MSQPHRFSVLLIKIMLQTYFLIVMLIAAISLRARHIVIIIAVMPTCFRQSDCQRC